MVPMQRVPGASFENHVFWRFVSVTFYVPILLPHVDEKAKIHILLSLRPLGFLMVFRSWLGDDLEILKVVERQRPFFALRFCAASKCDCW